MAQVRPLSARTDATAASTSAPEALASTTAHCATGGAAGWRRFSASAGRPESIDDADALGPGLGGGGAADVGEGGGGPREARGALVADGEAPALDGAVLGGGVGRALLRERPGAAGELVVAPEAVGRGGGRAGRRQQRGQRDTEQRGQGQQHQRAHGGGRAVRCEAARGSDMRTLSWRSGAEVAGPQEGAGGLELRSVFHDGRLIWSRWAAAGAPARRPAGAVGTGTDDLRLRVSAGFGPASPHHGRSVPRTVPRGGGGVKAAPRRCSAGQEGQPDVAARRCPR